MHIKNIAYNQHIYAHTYISIYSTLYMHKNEKDIYLTYIWTQNLRIRMCTPVEKKTKNLCKKRYINSIHQWVNKENRMIRSKKQINRDAQQQQNETNRQMRYRKKQRIIGKA